MTQTKAPAISAHHVASGGNNRLDLSARYGCGSVRFSGGDEAFYERRLVFDHVVDPKDADARDRFEAVAAAIRDVLSQRWVRTQKEYDRTNPKQVYYLSMEFLIGRSLANNITNLMLSPLVDVAARDKGLELAQILEQEPDAGLGNGGLGRLAACFIESMATMAIPAIGYGLRYNYGIFRQEIRDGSQVEQPDHWLSRPDPWEIARPGEVLQIPLASRFEVHAGNISVHLGQPSHLLGVPYDRPVVGYGGGTVNSLRLWQAATPDVFDFGEFSGGDFFGAVADQVLAETVSRMKFMMNGALTVGTRDGATIEIAEEAGEENVFLFGLKAEQVANSRGRYDPHWHYEHEPETREALDLIFSGHFNSREPGLFEPLRGNLLTHGDYYLHLADLAAYAETQARVRPLCRSRRVGA